MDTKVKICGIRSVEAAEEAVKAGADYLGFIFVEKSKRFIEPESAKKIIEKVKNDVQFVGVFQNANIEEINNIADDLQLDFVQLHGEESNKYCQSVKTKVIKTIKLRKDFNINETVQLMRNYKVNYFLLDKIKQGQEEMIDFNKAKYLAQLFPIFFAGGLNAENVIDAIEIVKPYAVDVAGGVETDGQQDLKKIRKFIKVSKGIGVRVKG